MKYALFILTGLLMTACSYDSSYEEQTKKAMDVQPPKDETVIPETASSAKDVNMEDRFTVTRAKIFKDSLSYTGTRGVYVVVDKKTGKEFVGISGVGIAETGSHQSGKITVEDER